MKEISNSRLTLLRKLNRKKYREQEQLFIIEGARAVEQVIQNGEVEISELFFDGSQGFWEQPVWNKKSEKFPSSLVSQGHFQEVSDTDNPQGVLALCRIPREAGIEELADSHGILLATDRIQDPGNLGTMIRTAVWFGVKGLLSGKGTVDLFHPKVVRSTAGATGALKHRNGKLERMLPELENKGWKVMILEGGEASTDIRSIDQTDKMVLLVGNEANGVNRNLFSKDRTNIRISSAKGREQVESLNAAIAASIALFVING